MRRRQGRPRNDEERTEKSGRRQLGVNKGERAAHHAGGAGRCTYMVKPPFFFFFPFDILFTSIRDMQIIITTARKDTTPLLKMMISSCLTCTLPESGCCVQKLESTRNT